MNKVIKYDPDVCVGSDSGRSQASVYANDCSATAAKAGSENQRDKTKNGKRSDRRKSLKY